jgi:hypothetical protein
MDASGGRDEKVDQIRVIKEERMKKLRQIDGEKTLNMKQSHKVLILCIFLPLNGLELVLGRARKIAFGQARAFGLL